MTSDNKTDIAEAIYGLQSDVCLSYDAARECTRIIKLNDDDFYYQADLVAGEIVKKINGKDSVQKIVNDVASAYGPEHSQAIWTGAVTLFDNLIKKGLIEKVK